MAKVNLAIPEEEKSYFDGGYWAYIGYSLLVGFVSVITLGIALPWMLCKFQRWTAKHTVVCGKRMYFDGTGAQLVGKYLLWAFLSVITLGIYGWWLTINIRKWIAKHTHYEGETDNNSFFDGGVLGLLGVKLLGFLVLFVPVVGFAWSQLLMLKWETRHTVIDSRRHMFEGTLGGLWVKLLVWGLLRIVTLGIFGLFVPVKRLRWETENKIDNEHTTQAMMARSEYRSQIHAGAATLKAYQVEDDMECVKAGITDAMTEPELLALANSGVRSAQYTYVVRYAQGQYTTEPYASLLAASAQAGYAPAISLYLQHNNPQNATNMLDTAAQRGQIWALRAKLHKLAALGRSEKQDASKLENLQQAVYYADLLAEMQEELAAEDQAVLLQCSQLIRKIQTKTPRRSAGKTVAAVIGVVLGIALLLGLVGAAISLLPRANVPLFDQINFDNSSGAFGNAFAENSMAGNVVAGQSQLNDAVVTPEPTSSGNYEASAAATEGAVNTTSESDFWKRFTAQMKEDQCVLTKVDEASNGTVKYELTCEAYFWKSLHYLEVLQDENGLQKLTLSGVRIYEPDSPDPTMNQAQWESIIRVIYKELDLGGYEDITPYTQSGSHTEVYGQWIFAYENTDQNVSLTVTKS